MFFKLLLLLALIVTPGVARAEWHEVSTPHFVVYGNDTPARLKTFGEELERFDQALRLWRRLPNQPVGKANRLTVYVLPTVAAIAKLHGGTNTAGFYIPRASGSIAFVPRRGNGPDSIQPQVILFHEYAHHLMFSLDTHSVFPAWLIEGWAEFHSTAQITKDGDVTFGYAPAHRAQGLLTGNPLPIGRILSADTSKLDAEQADALYGRGWALTHYLTFEPTRQGQLDRYIAEINSGKSAAEAAKVFGDPGELHREVQRYFSKRLAGFRVSAAAIKLGPITVRKLTPGEAATMDVRILSKRGVNDETAPGVYAAAKQAAAPFPNDPGAQLVLAEAAFDAKDYAIAEAAADRAIAADPNAIEAHIYKARAQMEIAAAKDDGSRETWRGIRAIISTANNLDTEHPEPLILYYQSFLLAGQRPTQTAKDALYRAFELAPYDPGLRMSLASLMMVDDKLDVARSLLLPLAYNPHGGARAEAAKALLAQVDKGLARMPRAGGELIDATP